MAWGEETVYKTALFGTNYNSQGVSSYTATWTATNSDFTVSLVNFNNNNNNWTVVKCGRKNNASVATITTSAAIDKAVSKVAVTIDAITTSNVNSIKLYTSADNSTWTEAGTFDKRTGTKEVSLSTPTAKWYYKVEFDCASGGSNGLVTVSKVEYYINEGGSTVETVATPTFSPEAGVYTSAPNVTISTGTQGATIYYTTDGTDPTTSSSVYSSPITISSTTTIKAMAVKNGMENSAVATATYAILDHAGTEDDPYTVADARNAIDANTGVTNVYATGIVSEIVTAYSSQYGNITFDIVDAEGNTQTIRAYRCTGNEAANVQVGDVVVVKGNLTKYNTTYEFAQGCEIVSRTSSSTQVAAGLAFSSTSVSADLADLSSFTAPTLDNPNNLPVTYTSSNTEVATVDADGTVTILAEGKTTITASSEETEQYLAGTASYTLTVIDPNAPGSENNPYTVADVKDGKADGKTEIYVIGYIVGNYNSTAPITSGSQLADTNLALADLQSETSGSNTIPVELGKNSGLRDEWGCNTNDGSIIGTQVLVKGDGTKYFSVNGIKNTTEVTAVAIPVTISAAGMATFSSKEALDFTGVKDIYAYTAQVEGSKVNFTRVYKVPANTGLLLRNPNANGESTVEAQVPVITETEAETLNNNALVAVAETIKSLATENEKGGTNYILNKKGDNVGFYKANSQKVGAGKAYLHVPASVPVREFIGFDDETDGIRQIENGQSAIDNAEIYNLSGQRVNKAQKGIYIVNGKKVVIK